MRSVIERAAAASPDAVFVCVTNPLDVMTYLAWRVSGLPATRVHRHGRRARLGAVRVRDRARRPARPSRDDRSRSSSARTATRWCRCRASRRSPDGRSPSCCPPRTSTRSCARTVGGGAEVVVAAQDRQRVLRAGRLGRRDGRGDPARRRARSLPSCVLLDGQYGLADVYMSVPAVLGRGGVVDVPELELTPDELAAAAGVGGHRRRGRRGARLRGLARWSARRRDRRRGLRRCPRRGRRRCGRTSLAALRARARARAFRAGRGPCSRSCSRTPRSPQRDGVPLCQDTGHRVGVGRAGRRGVHRRATCSPSSTARSRARTATAACG